MEVFPYLASEHGLAPPIVKDYYAGQVKGLNISAPDLAGIEGVIRRREAKGYDYSVLSNILEKQNEGFNAASLVQLAQGSAYTVTTGHQCVLLGGPLFFIYKIASAIAWAKIAGEKTGKSFYPLLWMATEDHDFEEVASLNIYRKKFTWSTDQKGPVGRMSMEGADSVVEQWSEKRSQTDYSAQLLRFLEESYLPSSNLAQATAALVKYLFKEYPQLLVLDPDREELKQQAVDLFRKELEHGEIANEVSAQVEELSQHYKLPVNPRELNLFYLETNKRERIVREAQGFSLADGSKSWQRRELLEELEAYPQRFSPNVVTRPLYQELILPNVAYVGGPSEVAYWLELVRAFAALDIPLPLILLRLSAIQGGDRVEKELEELKLSYDDLLQPLLVAKERFYAANQAEIAGDSELVNLRGMYGNFREAIQGLPKPFVAELVKDIGSHLKNIKQWQAKLKEQHEKAHKLSLTKLEKLHSKLHPEGVPQERYESFISYFEKSGHAWIKNVVESFYDWYKLKS